MKPSSAIQKGKILEDYIAQRLVETGLDPTAIRQKGSGSGLLKGDIHTALDIHFEAKNQHNANFKGWFKQAKEENVSHHPICIVWHLPQTALEETKVMIDLEYYLELLKGTHGIKSQTENPNLKWPLIKLKDAIKNVLKVLPE